MAEPPTEDRTDTLNVAWSDVVHFIRQLSHDLRNHLNAIELQSAYLSELEAEEELTGEIKRLREMISRMTSTLQSLSKAVSEIKPTLISYPAADFMEDLRKKIDHDFSGESKAISWNVQPGGAVLNVDPQLLPEAFAELFANAFQHSRGKDHLVASGRVDDSRFHFTLEEPKAHFSLPTDNWGREPLRKISQGHYALGLLRVRAIVEAHGGEIHAHYDSNASALITEITLPVSSANDA